MTAFIRNIRNACQPLMCAAIVAIALAFALAAGAIAFPAPAHAYYFDYDTANTAQQSLDTPGDPIPGAAIPDGVYIVGARTSSRMCILYPSSEDCIGNTNRETCYISVEGGNITAVFYISKAYTRLCMGDGEYAASLSDDSGTNDAPYMVGDPADGYVPHLYTFPVNALNEPIVFAAFDGANRSIDKAKWYTRTVVFTPTEDVMRAIQGGGSTPAPEPQPSEGDDQPSSGTEDNQSQGQAAAAGTSNGSGGNDGGNANNGTTEETPADQPQDESSTTTQAASAQAKRHGIPMTIAELGVPDFVTNVQPVQAVETGPKGLTQAQALGLLLAAGILAGCLARVVMFVGSKRQRV